MFNFDCVIGCKKVKAHDDDTSVCVSAPVVFLVEYTHRSKMTNCDLGLSFKHHHRCV